MFHKKEKAGTDERFNVSNEIQSDKDGGSENKKDRSWDFTQAQEPDFADEKTPEEMADVLEQYLEEDHSGKKKKKKRFYSSWSRKRKLLTAGGVLVVLFIISKTACGGGKETAPAVAAAPLAKGEVTAVLSLNGPVSGTESADVVSNLHAEVLQIKVREGDHVEKGQTIALIDSADAQKAVDIAQNSYDLAVSEYNENIRDTQHNYEKAVQDYQTAKLSYERNQVLYQAGDISSVDMEAASNALKDAARQKDSFDVEKGRALPDKSYELKVKSAQFELDQKKKDLENAEVKSPITGTVVRVNSKVGQFADKPEDEKPMFIIENLESLEMEIAVSEYSISKVKIGQKAEINADILNGATVEGEVISISPTGEEKSGGSSERVVPTTIRIEGGSSTGLIAGITAKASIVTGEAKDVFVVPQTALVQNADGTVSLASVEQGIVHMVPVTTGIESDLDVEVIPVEGETLTEGTMIITSPAGLSEGMAVTVR